MHPFRALGKNSGLLLVSDEEDMATWQRRSLPLQWAGGLKAQTETEANHTRYMQARGCGLWHQPGLQRPGQEPDSTQHREDALRYRCSLGLSVGNPQGSAESY